MADSMTKNSEWLVAGSKLFTVVGMVYSISGVAEELTDPTRPPASLSAPVVDTGAAVAPASLQSILISKNRRAAIIDGVTVELGGKYRSAKLIEVHESNVVLRGPQGRQVLALFPEVSIVPQAQGGGEDTLKRRAFREKK